MFYFSSDREYVDNPVILSDFVSVCLNMLVICYHDICYNTLGLLEPQGAMFQRTKMIGGICEQGC